MSYAARCPNMNHGRTNAPVKFCPSCGIVINKMAQGSCNQNKHADLRKQRLSFCHDCGKSLKIL